jgi:hypothetical protein
MRLPALLLALAALAAPAHAEKRTMTVAKFDRVMVAALVEVELRQGKQDVTAEESGGDFSGLKLEVRNGTLYVGRRNGDGANTDYRLVITAPDFKAISAAAASEVTSRHLDLQTLEINVSSASVIELKGACKDLAVNVSSGAHFDGEDLRCEDARARASTGGHADLWASGDASGSASTGGTIIFAGKPKSLSKQAALGGTITVQ